MNAPIRVSVVVPTFNRCDSLLVTLNGLIRQTNAPDFEAIVVSDGSTDGTADMVRAYDAPFPLQFFEQANAGPARARNQGVSEARGEIIVFLDDDVEPYTEYVARHAAHHQANPNLAVVGPMLPDPDRRRAEPVWIAWEHAMLEKQYAAWRTGEWTGVGAHHFYSGNASVRREHLVAVGGFNETFGRQEDVELAVRLETERGIGFRFDPDARGTHRPSRTFESWLKVPFAYGSLDVERAKSDGGRTWERVRHGYHARNRATRKLADLCLTKPHLSRLLRGNLLRLAQALYAAKRNAPALAALSAIYNTHYLEGAASALGSPDALRQVLFAPESETQAERVTS
ncbi:MAG: glycosyltransferase family 2 protein [Armatimonadetes bacterium]|nr:glycosyltransferase family 2 protein [Armatimonadota bacterium]